MKGNIRKYTIVSLLGLTVLLAGVAVFVGYKISVGDQAPEETAAAPAGCGLCDDQSYNQCCDGGSRYGTCMTSDDWMAGWSACQSTDDDGEGCYATVSGDVTSFTLSSGCGSDVRIQKYSRSYSGTSHAFYPSCITDSSNGSKVSEEGGSPGATYRAYSVGKCVQIDADGGGVGGVGVCRCVPPAKPQDVSCNGSCTDSSECSGDLVCSGGKCRNAECTGQADCTCNTTVSCFESCDSNNLCPNGLTCSDGKCVNTDCPTESDCACDTVDEPVCGDGTLDEGEECETGIDCANADEICNLETCLCEPPIVTQDLVCQQLEGDTSTVAPGESRIFQLELDLGTDDPPSSGSLLLRVSSVNDDTPVGRDGYNTPATALVSPISLNPTYVDTQNNIVQYHFVWEATNVDESSLSNGDYKIEVSLDGGSLWESLSACQLTLTYDSGEVPEANFLIVKEGAEVCSTSSGSSITYTISVTNLGPDEGVLDYVEDQLDSNVQSSWVSNISSSRGITGSLVSGVIGWTGTEVQRTYAADEMETFSYKVDVPYANLSTFPNGVPNIATVVFGDDQNRYNLVTPTTCQGDLPSTGIVDEVPWLFAALTITTGLLVYKLGAGQQIIAPALQGSGELFIGLADTLGLDGALRAKRKKEMEDKFSD